MRKDLKLVLAVDAVVAPMSGIGRYAWELARNYSKMEGEFKSLRFLFNDVWVDDLHELLAHGPKRRKSHFPKWMRTRFIEKKIRAKSIGGGVFHSPNYFLPEEVERGLVTIHDLSVFKFPETHPAERLRKFERDFSSTLKRTDHVITDSEFTKKEVMDFFFIPSEKISVIKLGVPQEFRRYSDAELVVKLADYGLPINSYSLCVSTLEPRKRIDQLLDVYSNLPSMIRNRFPLVLVGGKGWLSDKLLNQIQNGESQGWLRYLGYVPEPVLPFLYSGARAFIYPSMYEGFGLPVLEALASEIPTLAANCASLPEVAGDAGWLIDINDENKFSEGIVKILTDDAWRDGAIRRGREIASNLTWDECARETISVYRNFI